MRVPARKQTAGAAIAALEPAPRVRIPAEGLKRLVGPGERVAAGQLVAVSPLGAPREMRRHSPYEGTVLPSEGREEVVVAGTPGPPPGGGHRAAGAPEAVVAAAREAGLCGMGGAQFPTWVKLSPGKPLEWVIVNACESEPYLTCDARVLAERRDEVECGMRLAMRAVGARHGTIARDEDGYPGGYERVLVRETTGREIPPGGLPRDVGAVVLNVQTARALHHAWCLGRPLLDRVVTVDGRAVSRPGNYTVAIGTEVAHVLACCGADLARAAAINLGGPMMGTEARPDSIVAPGTGGVVALAADEIHRPADNPCIRCGDCLAACPVGLSARHQILRPDSSLRRCMECGMCEYVCPAERSLVAQLRAAKGRLA